MERRSRFACAVWFVLGCMACSDKDYAADRRMPCYRNSDCSDDLVCALGACRKECKESRDCGNGGSCVSDDVRAVCQPLAEKDTPCYFQRDCPPPLACASDYRCRNLCNDDDDCNVLGISGRSCAQDAKEKNYCAEPSETKKGELVVAPPKGTKTLGSGPMPPMSSAWGADGGAGMESPMQAGSNAGAGTGGESGAGGTGGTGGTHADAGGAAGASGTTGGTSGDGGMMPPQAGTGGASGSDAPDEMLEPRLWVWSNNDRVLGYNQDQLLQSHGDPPAVAASVELIPAASHQLDIAFDPDGNFWLVDRSGAAMKFRFDDLFMGASTKVGAIAALGFSAGGRCVGMNFTTAGSVWIGCAKFRSDVINQLTTTNNTLVPEMVVTTCSGEPVFDVSGAMLCTQPVSGYPPTLLYYSVAQLEGTGAVNETGSKNFGSFPSTLFWGPDGALYAAGTTTPSPTRTDGFGRFSAEQLAQPGGQPQNFTISDGLSAEHGVFDPDGNLWLSGGTPSQHIVKIDKAQLAQQGDVTVQPSVKIRPPVSDPTLEFGEMQFH